MKPLKGNFVEEEYKTYIYSGIQYDLRQKLPPEIFAKLHPELNFDKPRNQRPPICFFGFDLTFGYEMTKVSSKLSDREHANYMDSCYGTDVCIV